MDDRAAGTWPLTLSRAQAEPIGGPEGARARSILAKAQQRPAIISQPDQAIAHPRLHRSLGDTQHRGYLAVGVSAVIGQCHGLALQLREGAQAAPNLLPFQTGLHPLRHLVVGDRVRSGPDLPVGHSPLRADSVDSAPVRDCRQPRHRAAPARLKPARAAPHFEQYLLADFLCLKGVAHDGAHHAEQRRSGTVAHRLERGLIPHGHATQQSLQARVRWFGS